ncbi:MAG: preprotein translocase subunit SecA [Patescibacteria group bacterium]
MLSWLKRLTGDENLAALKRAEALVGGVTSLEETIRGLSDAALSEKTAEFRKRLAEGATIDSIAPEAFAVVREGARRTLGQRHFDVQIVGGFVLHQGGIAEMRTGEGKTLVATLPAYLNALSGKGVHVITVNDYLSRRDAAWMGAVYAFLGLSTGVLNHQASYIYDGTSKATEQSQGETGSFRVVPEFLRPCTRGEAYAADITYGTNQEFGFDYLHDNLEQDAARLRQRGYHYAIVDEIDSILIDEARTPLIISSPTTDAENLYARFDIIAHSLVTEEDFVIDEKHKQIALSDSGIEKAEKALGIENIYTDAGIKYVHHLETAVRANALFQKDKDYVVRDGEVVIVDEFTGRLQPGRRWSDGLHQAIEAKEKVSIQRESRTFASITYQNYFRLYERLSGMTGTAATSAEEFYKVYGLNTVAIPTNQTSRRVDHEDQIFQTERGKFKAIARQVKALQEKGQPVLVGTASVEKNELLSAHFKQEGVPHEILNAKNHEREAEIIAQAGRKGAVTIATNMAGRGVDIKLGGNPATPEDLEEVKKSGGLFVLGTERHEARRIDNQLRGRAGRQGDPGETQFFVSLEDSLMRVFASDMVKKVMGTFGIPEDEPIYTPMITRSLERAQTRIEELNFDARKHVLAYDDVMNVQRKSVYARRRALLVGGPEAVDAELMRLFENNATLTEEFEKKKTELGVEQFYSGVQKLLFQTIDLLWVDHLETMDYMRSSVNLRAYGQRDPLVEYKKEGLSQFKHMEEFYRSHVAEMLPRLSGGEFTKREAPQLVAVREGVQAIVGREASTNTTDTPGRNDKVTITDGNERREMKYKKAESLLATGKWTIVK